MNLKKVICVIVGCIGLELGALGAALPLLPAFPFLMLAAFCFARSSQSWIIASKTQSCTKTTLKALFRAEE